MKITDYYSAPDRNVVIITDGKATKELSEFLEHLQDKGNYDLFGTGDPETVVVAPIGATFRRLDGGTGTTFYVKETEVSSPDAVGWVAK